MELSLSFSPETGHSPAHAWPCGKYGRGERGGDAKRCMHAVIRALTEAAHLFLFSPPDVFILRLSSRFSPSRRSRFISPSVHLALFSAALPLPKVSGVTLALSKLVYSEVPKTAQKGMLKRPWRDPLKVYRQWERRNRATRALGKKRRLKMKWTTRVSSCVKRVSATTVAC